MTLLTGNYAPLIEEFAAENALSLEVFTAQSLIYEAMHKFPNALAIEAAFAFVSLAANSEHPILQTEQFDRDFCDSMYKAVSILAADIYAIEKLQGPSPRCRQVTDFWKNSRETFFSENSQRNEA